MDALLEPLRQTVKLACNSKSPIADRRSAHHSTPSKACRRLIAGHLAGRAQERSLPMVAALKPCREAAVDDLQRSRSPRHGYALNHWQGLTRFLTAPERHQPCRERHPANCLTKNALFAGHEVELKLALLASIVATSSLTTSTRQPTSPKHSRRSSTAIPSRIEDLMPWRFRKASSLRQ
jgi:hypothetical protein